MVTMLQELNLEKQIDRACAAQSKEMLPKYKSLPGNKAAEKAAIKAKINSQFGGM